MNRCVLTGATGLIGKAVLHLLEESGWITHALVRKEPREDTKKVRFIPCDLSREWSLQGLPEEADAVIHLAQSEHFREFPAYSEDIFRVNTFSTVRLLSYARECKAKTFVLASSGGIYGHGIEGFREDEPIVTKDDLGFYLSTKLCSELLADSFTPFLNIVILRFFFVFGPGQRTHMLIPRLIDRVRQGKPLLLQNREGIKINPTYISDAALSVFRALQLTESHKINVAGPDVLSLRSIGETIGQAVGREALFEIKGDSPPQDLIGDIGKMSELLHPPGVRFREGINRMLKTENPQR